jgi:hypothetical protein
MNLLNFKTLCPDEAGCKANTVMRESRLAMRYWFMAIHSLTPTKRSFSASELQWPLGHSTCNPIRAMLHKLRQIRLWGAAMMYKNQFKYNIK